VRERCIYAIAEPRAPVSLDVMRHRLPRGTRPAVAAIGCEPLPGNARAEQEVGEREDNG